MSAHTTFLGHRRSRTLLSFPLPEKIFFDKDRALQLEHQRKREYRRKLKSPHRLTPLDHVRELYEGAGYYLRCKRDLRPATAQPVLKLSLPPSPPFSFCSSFFCFFLSALRCPAFRAAFPSFFLTPFCAHTGDRSMPLSLPSHRLSFPPGFPRA